MISSAPYTHFGAATYSCGAYGASSYQANCQTTSGGGSSTPGAPDTGLAFITNPWGIASIICGVIVLAYVTSLVVKRFRKSH